jgi:iron(III) transport system permease protein
VTAVNPALLDVGREGRWKPISARALYQNGIFLLVLIAVAAPLVFLVLGSFSTSSMPGTFSFAQMGLKNYTKTWLDPDLYRLFWNTFIYVAGSTAVGITMAAALAWLAERSDMPGKIWIYAGVPMTLAIPGMLQAMAWILLLSPRIGFANKFIADLFALDELPFNIYTLSGMVFVEGLRLVPTAFLMLVPLLRSMDPSLEEAAATSGAAPSSTLRKISLMLMLPGLTAVLIYQALTALEVFEVPGILGLPVGIHVFSTKIYSILSSVSFVPAYGEANALAILYVGLAIFATILYARIISRSERYTIVTGKGYRPRVQSLGKWKYAAIGFVLLFLLLSAVAPFLVLAYISFLPYLQVPSMEAFASMTWSNYRDVFRADLVGTVLRNTVIMVVVTSTATAVISFLVSLVIVRSKFWGRKVLDQLAFLPHAIPGMVMGLAMLWIFLQVDKTGIPLFGTIWAISIAFTINFMSYGTRAMNAAILQIHKDLEEAASISGAPQWRVMWRVFVPLLMPSFVGVWIWTLLHAIRIAGTPLLLYEGAENQVLAVMMWNMWDEGYVTTVGALGTMLMIFLLLLTLALRVFGFGRSAHIQGAESK